ncbi:MAG: hypothetical protein JNM55_15290 [Anaerolineales bacterium]|nr:hypothetical protein [Anaerolineales bacterium]
MESQTQEPIEETPAAGAKKSNRPYFIAAGLIVLLGVTAFIAMRYFTQQDAFGGGPMRFGESGPQLSISGGPGGAGGQTFELDITPAEELPKTEPEARGLFVERKDNSIFIGTGDVTVMVSAGGGDAEPAIDADYSGDKVEVVISNDTVIYRDATELDPENPGATVQQVVEPSTIDDITPQSSITVWGRKAGDRIIADIIVVHSPFVFRKAAP